MLALIGNLDVLEVLVIVTVAIIVFGKRLPEVSMRGAAHLMKLRREVVRMWRDAGLEDELRKVRREIETVVPRHLPTPEQLIRQAEHGLDRALEPESEPEGDSPEETGAVAPIDPLLREALDQEPGHDDEHGPGDEYDMYGASLQPRTEPEAEPEPEPEAESEAEPATDVTADEDPGDSEDPEAEKESA